MVMGRCVLNDKRLVIKSSRNLIVDKHFSRRKKKVVGRVLYAYRRTYVHIEDRRPFTEQKALSNFLSDRKKVCTGRSNYKTLQPRAFFYFPPVAV